MASAGYMAVSEMPREPLSKNSLKDRKACVT